MKKFILFFTLFLILGVVTSNNCCPGQPGRQPEQEKEKKCFILSQAALELLTQAPTDINLKKTQMLALMALVEGKEGKVLFSQKLEKIIFGFPLKYELRNNYLFLNKKTGKIDKRTKIKEENDPILSLVVIVLPILFMGLFTFIYNSHF